MMSGHMVVPSQDDDWVVEVLLDENLDLSFVYLVGESAAMFDELRVELEEFDFFFINGFYVEVAVVLDEMEILFGRYFEVL